jgi:hypothetical protein
MGLLGLQALLNIGLSPALRMHLLYWQIVVGGNLRLGSTMSRCSSLGSTTTVLKMFLAIYFRGSGKIENSVPTSRGHSLKWLIATSMYRLLRMTDHFAGLWCSLSMGVRISN